MAEGPKPDDEETSDTGPLAQADTRSPEELEAEIAALRARLDEQEATEERSPPGAPRRERHRVRFAFALILIILGSLLFMAANIGLYVRNLALNTDAFVDAVAPLPKNPEIADALATFAVDEIVQEVDLEQRVEDALPEDLGFLTGPAVSTVERFATDLAADIIQTDGFQSLWESANRIAHERARGLIDDDGVVTTTGEGEIQLRLGQLVTGVLGDLGPTSELFANLELPEDAGTVTLVQSDTLRDARTYLLLLDRGAIAMVIVSLLMLVGGVLLWPSWRKGLVAAGVGVAVAMALTVVALVISVSVGTGQIDDALNRSAAEAAADILLAPLRQSTQTLLLVGVVIAVVAMLTGPYGWAVALREWIRRTWHDLVSRLLTPEHRRAVADAAATYAVQIRVVIVALGVLILLFGTGISITSVLVLAALVVLALVIHEAIASASRRPAEAGEEAHPTAMQTAMAHPSAHRARSWATDHIEVVRGIVIAVGVVLLVLLGLTVGNFVIIAAFVALALLAVEVIVRPAEPEEPPSGPGPGGPQELTSGTG